VQAAQEALVIDEVRIVVKMKDVPQGLAVAGEGSIVRLERARRGRVLDLVAAVRGLTR
jgi:hypothetical protein